jgi:hypothetical protein
VEFASVRDDMKRLIIPAALAVAVVAVAQGCSDDPESTLSTGTGSGTGSGTSSGTGTGMEIPDCPETCQNEECTCTPCRSPSGTIRCIEQFCSYDATTGECEYEA